VLGELKKQVKSFPITSVSSRHFCEGWNWDYKFTPRCLFVTWDLTKMLLKKQNSVLSFTVFFLVLVLRWRIQYQTQIQGDVAWPTNSKRSLFSSSPLYLFFSPFFFLFRFFYICILLKWKSSFEMKCKFSLFSLCLLLRSCLHEEPAKPVPSSYPT